MYPITGNIHNQPHTQTVDCISNINLSHNLRNRHMSDMSVISVGGHSVNSLRCAGDAVVITGIERHLKDNDRYKELPQSLNPDHEGVTEESFK